MEFNTLFTGKNFIELDRVDSTNNYAANLLIQTNVPDGTVILAHFQEKGRGQMGNEWRSTAGQNIMTTIVYHLKNFDANQSFLLSKAIALGIFETINEFVKQDVSIKWPNDIYVDDQKISGMLIENKWQGKNCSSIIGIGLNVNQHFFGELNATSLSNCTGLTFDIKSVMNVLLGKIEKYILKYKSGKHQEISQFYWDQLLFVGAVKQFRTKAGEIFEGKIRNVENSGHLVIEDINGNTRKFLFKEVFIN